MKKTDIEHLEKMITVGQDLLKEYPDDSWLRRGIGVMQSEVNKLKGIPNKVDAKMQNKKEKWVLDPKKWNLYTTNFVLMLSFIPIFCILSVVLPIHSDNVAFYVSEILFMFATILIPIEKLMRKYFSNNKILPNIPIIHGVSIILSLLFFAYWMLTLSNW